MTQFHLTIRQMPLGVLLLCLIFVIFVFDEFSNAQSKESEQQITVVLKDFSVHPSSQKGKTGTLTLKAMNEGLSTHELVIIRTDLDPTALPRKKVSPHQGMGMEFMVNEDDSGMKTIDEIEEFPAGTSQTKTVVLDPGHYVLFCNIPGHYDKGMYASLHIVKQ